jgi:hypothetical protein
VTAPTAEPATLAVVDTAVPATETALPTTLTAAQAESRKAAHAAGSKTFTKFMGTPQDRTHFYREMIGNVLQSIRQIRGIGQRPALSS